MSLQALSEASGLKLKMLKDLENGKQMDLEMNELFRLCMALDVLPSKLVKDAEEE